MANHMIAEGKLRIYANVRDTEETSLNRLITLVENIFHQGQSAGWINYDDYAVFQTFLAPAREYQIYGLQYVISAGSRYILKGHLQSYFAANIPDPYIELNILLAELSSFIRNELGYGTSAKTYKL